MTKDEKYYAKEILRYALKLAELREEPEYKIEVETDNGLLVKVKVDVGLLEGE